MNKLFTRITNISLRLVRTDSRLNRNELAAHWQGVYARGASDSALCAASGYSGEGSGETVSISNSNIFTVTVDGATVQKGLSGPPIFEINFLIWTK